MTPCFLETSGTDFASAFHRLRTICSSVNRPVPHGVPLARRTPASQASACPKIGGPRQVSVRKPPQEVALHEARGAPTPAFQATELYRTVPRLGATYSSSNRSMTAANASIGFAPLKATVTRTSRPSVLPKKNVGVPVMPSEVASSRSLATRRQTPRKNGRRSRSGGRSLELHSQTEDTPQSRTVLEGQLREQYGRVVYSHKSHEK